MRLNVELLLKVKEQILREPERFYMGTFFNNVVREDDEAQDCSTTVTGRRCTASNGRNVATIRKEQK